MQIILFFALAIAALAILFTVQNTTTTTISFLVWDTQAPLALVLLIALAAGALISFLLSLPGNIRTRWAVRSQRKKITELESKLTDLQSQIEIISKPVEEKSDQPDVQPATPKPSVPELPDRPTGTTEQPAE